MMKPCQSKPVLAHSVQFTGTNAVQIADEIIRRGGQAGVRTGRLTVVTRKGNLDVADNWWVVHDSGTGQFLVVSPEGYANLYEPASGPNAEASAGDENEEDEDNPHLRELAGQAEGDDDDNLRTKDPATE